jgi:hypothetical protein
VLTLKRGVKPLYTWLQLRKRHSGDYKAYFQQAQDVDREFIVTKSVKHSSSYALEVLAMSGLEFAECAHVPELNIVRYCVARTPECGSCRRPIAPGC